MTEEEKQGYKKIFDLVETYRAPYKNPVTKQVKLFAYATSDVLARHSTVDAAIRECHFLKFVSRIPTYLLMSVTSWSCLLDGFLLKNQL